MTDYSASTWLNATDNLRCWAIFSVYAMPFLAPISTTLGQFSQLIMLLVALIFLVRNWHTLKISPLLWLTAIFVGYVLLRGTIEILWGSPELRAEHWDGMNSWVRVGLLPATVFGLALVATGNWQRHALGALAALFIGTLLYMGLHMSPDTFFSALMGRGRYSFDIGNPLVGGVKIGAMVMGLLLFSGLIFQAVQPRRKLCGAFIVLWLFVLVFLVAAFIATGARSAWVAFLFAMVVVSLLWLVFERERILAGRAGKVLAASLGVLIIMITGALLTSDQLEKRWASVSESVAITVKIPLGKGEFMDLPQDSVGIRVALQVIGWDLFLQQPLFGYGLADPRYLQVEYPDLPPQLDGKIPTIFHNAHMDLLLRLGLTGYLLVVIFFVLLTIHAWKMLKTPGRERIMGFYFIGFVCMAIIWALGNQNFERFTLIHVYTPIFGMVCAGVFARQMSIKQSESGA